MKKLSIILCLTISSIFSYAQKPNVEFVASEEFKKANLPFSEMVIVNNVMYLSGQIGSKPDNPMILVEGGIKEQAKQALENIREVLERNGSSMKNVVKCTIMLADISEWAEFNSVYVQYFPSEKPARSAFGTNGLALGAKIEIECIAIIK